VLAQATAVLAVVCKLKEVLWASKKDNTLHYKVSKAAHCSCGHSTHAHTTGCSRQSVGPTLVRTQQDTERAAPGSKNNMYSGNNTNKHGDERYKARHTRCAVLGVLWYNVVVPCLVGRAPSSHAAEFRFQKYKYTCRRMTAPNNPTQQKAPSRHQQQQT
jgi:hypothetical protein